MPSNTAIVIIGNVVGGDEIRTRWHKVGGEWDPSGRAIRHYRSLGPWADLYVVSGDLTETQAHRIMRQIESDNADSYR